MIERPVIHLPDIVGGGYGEFWRYKGRYRVLKGSRASKKSTTTALNLIYRIMAYPQANALVVRKVYQTLKDSVYAQLKWAIARLGVTPLWEAKQSPLELVYLPTGQKILFRGLDDPLKITSVVVEHGALTFLWLEEAYEITREEDFDMLDESIRGEAPEGLFKQITLTFNPWNERHWLKRRFFDSVPPDTLAITRDYTVNEWLDESDRQLFERMKEHNPRRYRVAGMGEWGVSEGVVYENWEEARFEHQKEAGEYIFGLDFGYTNDPSALFCGKIDTEARKLYVFDELYAKGMSNERLYEEIERMGYRKEIITADSAEPKSIDRLRNLGIPRIRSARKGADSIRNGIDYLQGYKIIIHPHCVNFLREISNYAWATDREGNRLNRPEDEYNHLMDAMRYAAERNMRGATYTF